MEVRTQEGPARAAGPDGVGDRRDLPLAEFVGLDRAQAKPPVAGDLEQAGDQVEEAGPARQVLPVRAEMDPRQDQLPVAGVEQVPRFIDRVPGRSAPAAPPDLRHDAVRAREAAAVLDLHEGPRPARKAADAEAEGFRGIAPEPERGPAPGVRCRAAAFGLHPGQRFPQS
jgi:hypothetical protein